MISRKILKAIENNKKSALLLGPRQVGKSTLIKSLKPDLTINLAYENTFLEYASNPKALVQEIETSGAKSIFIDEVQRLPSLLNTIQYLVDDNKSLKFYLTGSSARKLKRGKANLLPGRILNFQLGPFISAEFNHAMDTQKVLEVGSLPEMYLSESFASAKRLLSSYVGIYLKEEIQAEAVSRNLESFSRFLKTIVSETSRFVDYSKLAKAAKISRHACARYFEVLEDTLIGQRLYPFEPCIKSADLVKHPKFYLFDPGIYNGMIGNFSATQDRRGILAEQLIFSQLVHSAHAFEKDIELSTFRTRGGMEIDFIAKIGQTIFAIEVKSSDNLFESDVKHLKAFKTYYSKKYQPLLFHLGNSKKKIDGIWCLPWQEGLQELGF